MARVNWGGLCGSYRHRGGTQFSISKREDNGPPCFPGGLLSSVVAAPHGVGCCGQVSCWASVPLLAPVRFLPSLACCSHDELELLVIVGVGRRVGGEVPSHGLRRFHDDGPALPSSYYPGSTSSMTSHGRLQISAPDVRLD